MVAQAIPNTQKMKFTKTETEYNMKSVRFLLLTITAMFLVIASLMIVLGISVYSHYHGFATFYEDGQTGRFLTPSVLSVFLGMVLLVVSSFGFFGSLKQSTCMVNLYAFILSLILIVKLIIVILAFTTNTDTIMTYVYIPIQDYVYDAEIRDEIDSLQAGLGCCGGYSYRDYMGMDFSNGNFSTVIISKEYNGDIITMLIPSSCCVSSAVEYCTRMYANGCKAALVDVLVQNATVLGVLGVSVMFIKLLGVIFALLLARCIRKLKSERALMNWKIKEQMILAMQIEGSKTESQGVYIDPSATSIA